MITRAQLRVVQRVLGTIGILIALSAFATMFVPFRILDIQCGSAISGSKVEIGAPVGSLIQGHERPVCSNKGSSRLINASVVIVLAGALGIAGWFLPLEPAWLKDFEEFQDTDDDGPRRRERRPRPDRSLRADVEPSVGRDWASIGVDDTATSAPARVATRSRVVVGEGVRAPAQVPDEPAVTPPVPVPAAPPGRRAGEAAPKRRVVVGEQATAPARAPITTKRVARGGRGPTNPQIKLPPVRPPAAKPPGKSPAAKPPGKSPAAKPPPARPRPPASPGRGPVRGPGR